MTGKASGIDNRSSVIFKIIAQGLDFVILPFIARWHHNKTFNYVIVPNREITMTSSAYHQVLIVTETSLAHLGVVRTFSPHFSPTRRPNLVSKLSRRGQVKISSSL